MASHAATSVRRDADRRELVAGDRRPRTTTTAGLTPRTPIDPSNLERTR
jgi:hypothetical protein